MLNLCKGTICHPYINIVCVRMCVRHTEKKCMRFGNWRLVFFLSWLIVLLVRLMLGFSLFGILSQLSRTSSSSRRRWESVMNLMYWLVRVISSLYRVLSVTYWGKWWSQKTTFSQVFTMKSVHGLHLIYSQNKYFFLDLCFISLFYNSTSWIMLSEAESSLVFFKGDVRGSTWAL